MTWWVIYGGVFSYSFSKTYLALAKVSPSVLLTQDSVWSVLFVSAYQHHSSCHVVCTLCSILLICSFDVTHVYYLGWLCTSRGHVAYMFSVACTDRVLVIEMCHIYGGISGLIYGGNSQAEYSRYVWLFIISGWCTDTHCAQIKIMFTRKCCTFNTRTEK